MTADPPPTDETPDGLPVLSVSLLTARIKDVLETTFPSVWVAGEVSNVARPASGHLYLTLKDEGAQIRAVAWRGVASRLPLDVEDGIEVLCRGDVDVYAPRGSYQLIVRHMEPRGVGSLQAALRKLQQRLDAEGLFDGARKRPLPTFPRRIAFVTSPTGAAVRDFLEVIRRRWRGADVLVVPARVQGEAAAPEIVAGIETANRLVPRPDVLVVGRGGGSIEDLWCFNDERIVRAVFASEIPVVSAVGHEIDVTLCDLVADVRALTPSEAAERVVPSTRDVAASLQTTAERLQSALRGRVDRARAQLESIAQSRPLRRPMDHVHERARRLDELASRGTRAMRARHTRSVDRLGALAGRIESLSPLGVLARGYSLTTHTEDGRLVRNVQDAAPGEQITTRLAAGRLVSRVEEVLDAAQTDPAAARRTDSH